MDPAPQPHSAGRPLAINRFGHWYPIRRQKEIFCVRVEIERGDIGGRWLLDGPLFARREFRLELVGDSFCDFALNGENVGQIAIVSLRPPMRVSTCIDQLRVHSHAVACALNTSFHECATPSSLPIRRRLRFGPVLYCITEVRLITFKSAILARSVRISSCTPSVKNALSGSRLRFSNGSTAMLFSGICVGADRL